VEGRFSATPSNYGRQVAHIDDDAARSIRCRDSLTGNISESESSVLTSVFIDEKQGLLGSEAILDC